MQRPPAGREARRALARARDPRRCGKRATCQPPRGGSSGPRGRGAGGRRPGARWARVRARGLVWGLGPGGRGVPPWGRSRARGSREKQRAVAAHQPCPRGQAWGQRFQEHLCLERGLQPTCTSFASRWAATLNLIRSESLGIIRGLDPVERPGFVSRLFNEL